MFNIIDNYCNRNFQKPSLIYRIKSHIIFRQKYIANKIAVISLVFTVLRMKTLRFRKLNVNLQNHLF